jgi:hypothetical protein
MKKLSLILVGLLLGVGVSVQAATTLFPGNGGTGTSTPPTYGNILVGNSQGTYTLTATSSLGIVGAASSPGGSSGQVQYNGSGSFAGVATTTLTPGTNVTFTGTPGYLIGGTNLTINATGGSGAFEWTPQSWGNSTSTTLGFLNGFISTASSTINAILRGKDAIFSSYVDAPYFVATSTTATSTFAGAVQIGGTVGDQALKITSRSGGYPSSDSIGGMVNLTNTNNFGSALTIYSNAGVGRTNDLLRIKSDNVLNDQRGLFVTQDGTRSAALFDCTNATRVSGGECVTITDVAGANRTTLGVSGAPIGLGLLKFTVNSGADTNASALSMQIDDTDPQGIFIDTIAGYTGKFLNIRNNGTELLTMLSSGNVGIGTSSPYAKLSVVGETVASHFTATTTATSTLPRLETAGLNLTNFLTFNGVTGSTWASFCTTITGSADLCDGSDASGVGGTGLSTTSPTANDQVLVYNSAGAGSAYSIATTSLSITGPFTIANPIGVLKNGAVTYTGLATTSQPSSSNLLVSNGGSGVFGVATTTPTFGLGLTGGGIWDVLGSAPTLNIATSSLYSGTTGQFPYFSGTNTLTATSSLFLDTTGKIGIGTTTPVGVLSILAGTISGATVGLQLTNSGAFAASEPAIDFVNSAGGIIHGRISSVPGTSYLSSAMKFSVANSSKVITERMRIDVNGNLGIGTTTPGSLLSLGNTGNDTINLSTTATSTFGSGINLRTGCFAVNSVCITGGGGVTAVTGTWPIISSGGTAPNLTWGGLATSTAAVIGNIPYFSGAKTFANVATSTLAVGASISNSGTLGYQIGGTASSLSLNMANANTWTALQTFAGLSATNATTTGTLAIPVGASVITPVAGNMAIDTTSGQLRYSDITGTVRVISPVRDLGFSYATSTWSGTTTRRIGPAPANITVSAVYCETNAGTVGVSLYDGTNRANYVPTASSTINKNLYTSNNTFTAGETMRVDLGTPASSPQELSCRFLYTYDAD